MNEILDRKILIKDSEWWTYVLICIGILILTFYLPLKLKNDSNLLVVIEQSLFIILSAILFVFNDVVIGFKSISKLKNEINKYSSNSGLKKKVLNYVNDVNDASYETEYEEFFLTIDKRRVEFKEEAQKFKIRSYRLYVVFSLMGLLSILLSQLMLKNDISKVANFTVNFLVHAQISLIFLWILSAFQAEKQKIDMFDYIEVKNIKKNLKQYISNKREKDILLEKDHTEESE